MKIKHIAACIKCGHKMTEKRHTESFNTTPIEFNDEAITTYLTFVCPKCKHAEQFKVDNENKKTEGTYKQRISSKGGIFLKVSDKNYWAPCFDGNEVYCSIYPRRIYICDEDDTNLEFIGTKEKIQKLLLELIIEQPLTYRGIEAKGFKSVWTGQEKWSWPIDYDLE